jgi:hypothetical protein
MMGVLAGPAVAVYVLATEPSMVLKPWVLWLGVTLGLAVSNAWAALLGPVSGTQIGIAVVLALLVAYTVWRDPGEFRRPMLYLALGAVVAGVSLNYLFLPIRALQFPPINEGEPTNWHDLLEVLNRTQYGKPSVFLRQADFVSQLGMYLQYFGWQFARDWGSIGSRAATALFTLIGFTGAYALWRSDRRAFWASAALMGTLTFLLVFYLNFKYGWSYPVSPARGEVLREVRERDYFFLVSFSAFGLWVAVGFGAMLQTLAEMFRPRTGEGRGWLLASPLLALALVPLFGNRITASRAHETAARDFAADLLQSVEPYGILVTAGDNDTFPLWFAQEVEGIRPDVTIANLSLMNTRWHLKQLHRRIAPAFDPSRGAEVWRSGTWTRPEGPVLSLSEAQIDSLPEVQQVPKNGGVRFDSLTIAFGEEYLTLSDIATIFLIRENLGRRPIYFAWSAGGYPDQTLGLTGHLITNGLARKLSPTPVTAGGSLALSRGLGWIDTTRTRALLTQTYHYSAITRSRPRGWVDKPSQSILSLYEVVYGTAAPTFAAGGDSALAVSLDSVATAVRQNLGESKGQ